MKCVNHKSSRFALPHGEPTNTGRCVACERKHQRELAAARASWHETPPGTCRKCKDETEPARKMCSACIGKAIARRKAKSRSGQYQSVISIEDWLSKMTTKILRQLRHRDWATSSEIALALNVPTHASDRRARNNFHSSMRLLVRDQRVVRREVERRFGGRTFEYRLASREACNPPEKIVRQLAEVA